MGDIEHGTCSVCKATGPINRKYYHYDILCQCHMPKHFEIVYHCNNCEPMEPDSTKITMDTTILKQPLACEKVLRELHSEWGENWDMVVDFFGKDLAEKIDKAIGYEQ